MPALSKSPAAHWLGNTLRLALAVACIALSACTAHRARDLVVYEAAGDGVTNVFTIDPANSEIRQLTHGANFDGNPAWSPDRKHIVFSSQRDGQAKNDLYVMNADGSAATRLTDTPTISEFSPRYSPDGTKIAYVSQSDTDSTVQMINSDGSDLRVLAGPYKFAEFPAWTKNGTELYYSAIEAQQNNEATNGEQNADIFSVDLQTREVNVRIQTPGADECPHISADGAHLIYASTQTAAGQTLSIYAHDLASSDVSGAADARLTDSGSRDDYGDPSPDGKHIVFISDRNGSADLYVMDADGSQQRRLTNTDLRNNVPDW